MRRRIGIGDLAATGILTALALMIPIVFTFLRITIPPFFTATLMSHVPSMLAMLMGPFAAVGVGLGSALGFTVFVGPAIGARALSHALFAWVGNIAWNRGLPLWLVLLIALPVHAVFEMAVVWILGGNLAMALTTLIGTAIHHCMDGVVALGLVAALRRSGVRWFEQTAH